MTWTPIQLADGAALAQIVAPADLTRNEADILIYAVNNMVQPAFKPEQNLAQQIGAEALTPVPASPALVTSSLGMETKIVVDTATAAHYLNRRPQTLRIWACQESGPVRPLRINGRLAWPVAEIRRCVGWCA